MDENGTESGGVDLQIPVTAGVDASGYQNVSQLEHKQAVALGLGLVPFGVCVRRLWFGLLLVGSNS